MLCLYIYPIVIDLFIDGNCGISTSFVCEYVKGIWTEGRGCPCDVEVSSCCIDGGCYEQYSRDACEDIGGVFVEGRPCVAQACRVLEHLSFLLVFF